MIQPQKNAVMMEQAIPAKIALWKKIAVMAIVVMNHAVIALIASIAMGPANRAFTKLPTMLNYRRVHM